MSVQAILNAKQAVQRAERQIHTIENERNVAVANRERLAQELEDLGFDVDGDLSDQLAQMEGDLATLTAKIEADVTELAEKAGA